MLNQGGKDAWAAGHRMNGPLLGWKFGVWEGGHRVPFIIRWPGKVPAGTKSDQVLCSIDLLASFAAVVGRELQEGEGPDSFNMLPALTGVPQTMIRDHLILAPFREQNLAVRKGQWMFIGGQGSGGFGRYPDGGKAGGPRALSFAGRENSDVEGGKIKTDAPKQQLYDLNADLRQQRNIIEQHPEVANELRQVLLSIRSRDSSAARK